MGGFSPPLKILESCFVHIVGMEMEQLTNAKPIL